MAIFTTCSAATSLPRCPSWCSTTWRIRDSCGWKMERPSTSDTPSTAPTPQRRGELQIYVSPAPNFGPLPAALFYSDVLGQMILFSATLGLLQVNYFCPPAVGRVQRTRCGWFTSQSCNLPCQLMIVYQNAKRCKISSCHLGAFVSATRMHSFPTPRRCKVIPVFSCCLPTPSTSSLP